MPNAHVVSWLNPLVTDFKLCVLLQVEELIVCSYEMDLLDLSLLGVMAKN